MATQQIRNIINNQIDSVISRAEREARNEGKKRLNDLKKKIPTPQEIFQKMKSEINNDTCSNKGNEAFEKKYDIANNKLKNLEHIITRGEDKLNRLIEKIKPITEEKGPIKGITSIQEFLSPIIEVLKYIIALSPILLLANSGPTSSGAVTDQIQSKRDKANEKVLEWAMLFATIPAMILMYKNKALNIFSKIKLAKNKLSQIKEKVIMLRAYLDSLKLQHTSGCDNLINPQIISDTPSPPPTGNTDLADYLNLLQQQYNDVYQQLQNSGNEKALKRIFTIKENLEENYNTSFEVINPQN